MCASPSNAKIASPSSKTRRCATPQRVPAADLDSAAKRPRVETLSVLEHTETAVTPATTLSPAALPSALLDLDAIVINLERRADRMQGCASRLHAYCPWLRFSQYNASDGRQTVISENDVTMMWHTGRNVFYQKQRAIRKGWNDLDAYEVRELAHSPGERGCSMSHIRAWKHCLAEAGSTQRPLLVLEDDAAPTPDFTATFARALAATPADADVLYLGYSQAADWRREVSADVVESEYVWTTVGYLVWPSGAQKLLDRLPIDQPVDNWMATVCADGHLKAYCVRPKIIRQAEAWNVNSDVGHSDEQYWGPCSDIHHSDDFYWGNPTPLDQPASSVAGARTAVDGTGFLLGGSIAWDLDSDDSDTEGM